MDKKVTLAFDDTLLAAARDLAAMRETALEDVLSTALRAELARCDRVSSGAPTTAHQRYCAMIQTRLSEDFAYAYDWSDLFDRLADKGIGLRKDGNVLALFGASNGEQLCKAAEIGFSPKVLESRFGDFPISRALH